MSGGTRERFFRFLCHFVARGNTLKKETVIFIKKTIY